MIENTSSLAGTSFDDEDDFSWLLEYLESEIDWNHTDMNTQYLAARAYVAESLMAPECAVRVPKNTPAGELYRKLRLAAKDDRARNREYEIAMIHREQFSNMELERGRALATLTYAKQQLADREQYTLPIRGGYLTTNDPFKTAAAVETLTKGRKYGVRYRKNQYGQVSYNTTNHG